MTKFFISCALGFEEELQIELKEIWPFLLDLDGRPHSSALDIITVDKGGIEIQCPFHLGLQLNLFSKLSHRILWRFQEFRVRDFPKLFQRLQKIKSSNEFAPFMNKKFNYEIAASKSRLNNEKRIAAVFTECWGGPKTHSDYCFYIRMYDDLCVISVDTSGEHLHYRSQRTEQGAAPLRETVAAFCARQLLKGLSAVEMQKMSLVDPMAGTGTLLSESMSLFQPVVRDDFAFQKWPWIPKLLQSKDLRKNYLPMPLCFSQLYALDREASLVAIAKKQLAAFTGHAQAIEQDLFAQPSTEMKAILKELQSQPVLLISNPPYGERLKVDFTPLQLLSRIVDVYRPLRFGLLLSQAQALEIPEKFENKNTANPSVGSVDSYFLQSKSKIQNGGLSVEFCVYTLGKIV